MLQSVVQIEFGGLMFCTGAFVGKNQLACRAQLKLQVWWPPPQHWQQGHLLPPSQPGSFCRSPLMAPDRKGCLNMTAS
jgi:hypothetical protein